MPFYNWEGLNIYYEVAGEGEPLLLINGIAADARQWEPLVGYLKRAKKGQKDGGKGKKTEEILGLNGKMAKRAKRRRKFWG